MVYVLHLLCHLYSSRSIQRKYTTGRPDQKDLSENLAATQGLAHMITECQRLFQVRIYDSQHYSTARILSIRNGLTATFIAVSIDVKNDK